MSVATAINYQRAQPEQLLIGGLNHQRTEVALRELFSVGDNKAESILKELVGKREVGEAVVVSTCNRTELITVGNGQTEEHLRETLAAFSGVPVRQFSDRMYCYKDREAMRHLLRVAAGLDSLVLGEPQVLGQLKQAFQFATECGTADRILNRVFSKTFRVAKLIRSSTELGHGAVSIASSARELAEQIFPNLSSARILLIGAGETGALMLRHLWSSGARSIYVANRSIERAIAIAEEFEGIPLALASLDEVVDRADIVICAAPRSIDDRYLFDKQKAEQALKRRHGSPQFLIDIAVPRGIEPSVEQLDGIFLYNVDDLKQVVAENLGLRSEEAKRAELLIEEEVKRFERWRTDDEVEDAIASIRAQIETLKSREIQKTIRRLEREGAIAGKSLAVESALQDLTRSLSNKLLHRASEQVRDDPSLLAAFRRLFPSDRNRC